jgi:hypothetical protein
MDRHLIAYLLIGLLAATLAVAAAWTIYNSRDRKVARRRSRETALRHRRFAEQNEG